MIAWRALLHHSKLQNQSTNASASTRIITRASSTLVNASTGQCLRESDVRANYKGESAQQPQSSPEGRWWRMIITSSSAGLPGAEAAGGDHIQLARSLYNRPCAIRELADSVFTTENSHLSETSVSKQQLVVCPKHVRYYIRCVSRPPMGHSHRDKAMLFGQLCVNKRRNTRGLMTTR